MKVVNKNISVRIYPSKADKNDNGEKIANINIIESHFGIYRFIYNQELTYINKFRQLLIQNAYSDNVMVNKSSCGILLDILRDEYSFLEKAESSSRQQAYIDLINAFKRFKNPNLKSRNPTLKTKKNKKDNFRIMNNNNNLRLDNDKNGFCKIRLPKLRLIKFKTSKKYKELLQKASQPNDPTTKIKHVTIKKVNNEYYAVFNVESIHIPVEIIGPRQQIGIDIGCGKLAVLSNNQAIPNLDLTKEVNKIIHYQQKMSHTKKDSIRYCEAKRLHNKCFEKLVNRRNDYYNKVTAYIVKNCSFVAVQNENIIAWKHNKHLSRKIQLNAPRIFLDMLEYKCKWNNIVFVKVPKNFPSTQICSHCGKKYKKISGIGNLGIRDWTCPFCGKHHDRDINTSINILNKGLQIVGTTVQ